MPPRFFHADLRVNGFDGKPVIHSAVPFPNLTLRIVVGIVRRQADRGVRNFVTIAAWTKRYAILP